MESQPGREVDRITDLSNKIKELNEDIKRYDGWIREEEREPETERRNARIAGWERQIAGFEEDKAALRAALTAALEAENAERRLGALSLEPHVHGWARLLRSFAPVILLTIVVVPPASAYPQAIPRPSSAKPNDVSKAYDMGSFSDLPVALELSKFFYGPKFGGNNADAAAVALQGLSLVSRSRLEGRVAQSIGPLSIGLFRADSGVTIGELSYTSVLASCLAASKTQFGGLKARWLHQIVDRAGGEIDLLCCSVDEKTGVWNVVMLGEAGFKVGCTTKDVQVAAYGANVSPMMVYNEVLLLVELIVSPTNVNDDFWLRVSATFLPVGGPKLKRVRVWEGAFDARSCEGLLCACDAVVQYNRTISRAVAADRISDNMWRRDGRIYKVYDYRNRAVAVDQRRDHTHSLKLIDGARSELCGTDINVISYPEIAGGSAPSSVQHVISLIRAVRLLHDKGIVHADVRASNAIFCADGNAVLIDFDWSGPPKERKYPAGFCSDIDDGARARDVEGGRPVKFCHDYFAVGAIMEMCEVPQAVRTAWRSVSEQLKEITGDGLFDLESLLSALEPFKDEKIDFTAKTSGKSNTGSPERAERPAKKSSSSSKT